MLFTLTLALTGLLAAAGRVLEQEPKCYSKFDWEDKLLEKSIKTELNMQQYLKDTDKAMSEIRVYNDELKTVKAAIDKTVEGLKSHVDSQVQMVLNNLTASLQVIEAAKDSIDEKIKEALSDYVNPPTIVFNANAIADTSPGLNQIIVFQSVLQNIGGAYNSATGIFTTPVNGTYIFGVQVCVNSGRYGQLQLVVDESANIILAIRYYEANADDTSSSDSVAVYLTKGQQVWVQSSYGAGSSDVLDSYDNYCWNHFSGALVHQ